MVHLFTAHFGIFNHLILKVDFFLDEKAFVPLADLVAVNNEVHVEYVLFVEAEERLRDL